MVNTYECLECHKNIVGVARAVKHNNAMHEGEAKFKIISPEGVWLA